MTITTYGFDFILYPFVIWKVGFFIGFLILTIFAAFIDIVTVCVYDKTKKDWLGIEAMKSIEESFVIRPVVIRPLENVFYWTHDHPGEIILLAFSLFVVTMIYALNVLHAKIIQSSTKVLNWARNRGDMATATALAFLFDPLIIVLYMRNGSNKYNWLSRRDWKIFLTATVVGNLYWAVLVLLGVEGAEYFQIVNPS